MIAANGNVEYRSRPGALVGDGQLRRRIVRRKVVVAPGGQRVHPIAALELPVHVVTRPARSSKWQSAPAAQPAARSRPKCPGNQPRSPHTLAHSVRKLPEKTHKCCSHAPASSPRPNHPDSGQDSAKTAAASHSSAASTPRHHDVRQAIVDQVDAVNRRHARFHRKHPSIVRQRSAGRLRLLLCLRYAPHPPAPPTRPTNRGSAADPKIP